MTMDDKAFLKGLNGLADSANDRLRAQHAKSREQEFKKLAERMAGNGYRFTPETVAVVKDISNGKGVCLYGDVGVGKTFLFQCIGGIPALNLMVAQGKSLKEIDRALESFCDTDILIDDVGVDKAGEYRSFGAPVKLFEHVLELRMDSQAQTHITTNLTGRDLLARYGARTVDRIGQLCTFHVLKGKSRRSQDTPKQHGTWFADFFLGKRWEDCARCCRFYDNAEHRCCKGKTREPRVCGGEPICQYF